MELAAETPERRFFLGNFVAISRISPYRSHLEDLLFSSLKNGGWKTIVSFWVSAYFQGRTVKLLEFWMSIVSYC